MKIHGAGFNAHCVRPEPPWPDANLRQTLCEKETLRVKQRGWAGTCLTSQREHASQHSGKVLHSTTETFFAAQREHASHHRHPRLSPTVGSHGGAVSYERGTPVRVRVQAQRVGEPSITKYSSDRPASGQTARIGTYKLASRRIGAPQNRQARFGTNRPASGQTGPSRDG